MARMETTSPESPSVAKKKITTSKFPWQAEKMTCNTDNPSEVEYQVVTGSKPEY